MHNSQSSENAVDSNIMLAVANAISEGNDIGYALFDAELDLVTVNAKFWPLVTNNNNISIEKSNPIQGIAQAISLVIPEALHSKIGPHTDLLDNFKARAAAKESYMLRHKSLIDTQNSFIACYQTFESGHTLFTIEDVTKAEHNKRILKIGLEVGSSGYWSYNFATNRFFFSDLIESRWTDKDRAKVKEKGLFGIIHPEDLPLIQNEWLKAVNGDGKLDVTYRVRLEKYGTLWLHNTGRLQYDGNGKKLMFVAFVRDITEDKKVRTELLAAQEASVAKSDFLAKMSHEIKTPLNAIIGMSDALSQEDLPEDVLETITFITNAAEGLNGLLSQTLDHAKLLSGNVSALPEETSLHSLVNNTCGMWKISCKNKNLSLSHTVDSSVPDRIMLDQHRFQQCLNNLLSNAIKFTPKGEIAVGVTARETRNGKQVLLISVKDTGIGMNDHALRNIFEPFKQADDSITRRFGGTGLGMAITKQLVGVLGGKISARSTEGKGTMFLMALPLIAVDTVKAPSTPPKQSRAPVPAPSIAPETEIIPTFAPSLAAQEAISAPVPDLDIPKQRLNLDKEHAGRLSGLRILVVEDNPINQAVVKKLISKEVESLTFANNGVEALNALRTQNFDLILMDIHMPVKDGIETTIEIRASNQAWANVIIIALTADPDYQQQRICRNIGMNDAIAKPVKRQDIINAIERTLENESYHAAPRHSDQMTG